MGERNGLEPPTDGVKSAVQARKHEKREPPRLKQDREQDRCQINFPLPRQNGTDTEGLS